MTQARTAVAAYADIATDDPAINAGFWAACVDDAAGVAGDDPADTADVLFAKPADLAGIGLRHVRFGDGSAAAWDGMTARVVS